MADLNPRELEVLRLVARGKRNKAIGDAIGITESTVKFHVASVLRKLEVASRGEAAALALSVGIGARGGIGGHRLREDGHVGP
ncbi:response regulator transcription factor [Streptomyces rapamycinicus]|uniref:DNA-binding NarL/FixJ family response regulator n=1 Tax=Streptomyces rapamycinicus TaxID=1226757 RepID=A0ABR6LAT7_9ACTN|nr:helix-turn-helix transcriptional regulator [Streptomyces rapamycinicus]MBB4779452.1 DNA-binding NarL/FixJ family response regulator [Streptomyces rapamycinicus]UTP28223.1 helix-turn-helix transcriptional regulator [Streptomyces rapamycinicus NRRL 5491]